MIYNNIGQLSRRILMGFVSSVFSLVLLAGSAAAQVTENVKATPALWLVEKDSSKTYMLGSFHLLPRNYVWFEGKLKNAFETADELVLETELTPEAETEIQAIMAKNIRFTDEDNLKNHLDAVHYQKLLSYAQQLMGADEAAIRQIKPWFMAIQLSVIAIMAHGMDPESGVDKYLAGLAKAGNKPISGLETPAEQLSALIDHPLPVQAAMLSDTLDELDDFKAIMDGYLAAWASGDEDKVAELMVEEMLKDNQSLYEALIVNRNTNWMPAIEAYITSGKTTFIVVGAAHLVGPDGLVKMLRAEGYIVDKIQ